ncbi:MAG: helix-turn-helix transcriptional regulator [Bacteroidales bacterium]|nr:helix-turn-helix transcriptional regulator [Bacteroidales bacterium]
MGQTTKLGDLLVNLRQDPLFWAEDAKTDFTEEIVRLMEEQGVTKKELAHRLGTSQSYITKVLNENVNFTIESMSKIAFALGGKMKINVIPAHAAKAQDASCTVICDTLQYNAYPCSEKDICPRYFTDITKDERDIHASNILQFPGLNTNNWHDVDVDAEARRLVI